MTALEQFNTIMESETINEPIERLRFFLSLALTGQDWLDVEQFIDGVSQQLASSDSQIEEVTRKYQEHAGNVYTLQDHVTRLRDAIEYSGAADVCQELADALLATEPRSTK